MIEEVAEDSSEVEHDDYIDDDDDRSDEDDDQPDEDNEQPADGSSEYRRRQPVQLNAIHKPSCDRCVRGKRKCHKEAGGGACYSCVVLKSRCGYAKSVHKDGSDREDQDVKEIKGKVKGRSKPKPKSERKSKETGDDEMDPPTTKGSKSKVKWVDISDDEDEKKSKLQTRRMKPVAAPAPGQLMSPESKFFFH